MTEEQIRALGPALAYFLDQFLFCCGYTQTFAHLGAYCRGLLSDLPRKSVEPIALAAGIPVRTLQEFLRDHDWHQGQVRDLLQGHVARTLAGLADEEGLGSVGLIDETGVAKKGAKTPGVQRQWCGELGKKENCLVTVHLGVARGRYQTLLDADLYLPQSWDDDRDRCQQAGIPDEVVYRPKWQIALEQLDRARANGVKLDWLTFDEEYGKSPEFLVGLSRRGRCFVGEVPKSFACFGRWPRRGQASSRADDLVQYSPAYTQQPWQAFGLPRQTLGEQVWQAKASRVWLSVGGEPSAQAYGLIGARNPQTQEEKYFIAFAAAEVGLGQLLRVGFSRWNVEHGLRLSKGELGFRHFEGRHYTGLLRHLTLCLLMLTFVAGQAESLRGEKSGGNRRAGLPRPEPRVPAVAGPSAGDVRPGVHVGGHSLSPKAEPGSPAVSAEAAARPARRTHARGRTLNEATPPTPTTSETDCEGTLAL